jgi:hypothetical protein
MERDGWSAACLKRVIVRSIDGPTDRSVDRSPNGSGVLKISHTSETYCKLQLQTYLPR